jgi:hypothetical protein
VRHLLLVARMVAAPFIGVLIGLMAWYLWTQEEILSAKTKFDA